MRITRLFIKNFRNWREAVVSFNPALNMVYGGNGHGKTTLLEAVHLLITGRSFRAAHLRDLVGRDGSSFHLEAQFVTCNVEQRLKFSYDGSTRAILHNSTPHTSWIKLLGVLRGVIMAPDDVALVKGAPSLRRHFLDLQIAQVDPLYVHYLGRYRQAMRQRNCLLRNRQLDTLDVWEAEMASTAAYICSVRHVTAADLAARMTELYPHLAGGEEQVSIRYQSSIQGESEAERHQWLLKQYERQRPRELEMGNTLTGPHRDDLVVAINGRSADQFGSEGQQRCCVAALKLAEWQRLRDRTEANPLLLVDDAGIGLDKVRRERLMHLIEASGQLFVSSVEDLSPCFSRSSDRFLVDAGGVKVDG